MSATKTTYTEALQEIVERYRDAGQPWPTDKRTIAAWAYSEGLWKPTRKSAVDELAKDIGKAMAHEYMVDPQGREIRRKYARRVQVELPDGTMKQATWWDDITTASPEHMQISFQQMLNNSRAECFHHKQSVDSYNQNWNTGPQLEFSYDFTEDIAEMEMPTEFPPEDEDDQTT
jgi:hypothetical protein